MKPAYIAINKMIKIIYASFIAIKTAEGSMNALKVKKYE